MKFVTITEYYDFNNQGILTDSSIRIIAKYITEQTPVEDIGRYFAKVPENCTELELENLKINYQATIYSRIKANEQTILEWNSILMHHYDNGSSDWLTLMGDERRGRSDEMLEGLALEYLNRTTKRSLYEIL